MANTLMCKLVGCKACIAKRWWCGISQPYQLAKDDATIGHLPETRPFFVYFSERKDCTLRKTYGWNWNPKNGGFQEDV